MAGSHARDSAVHEAVVLQGGHGHVIPTRGDTLTHHSVVVLPAMPSACVSSCICSWSVCALLVALSAVRRVGYLELCAETHSLAQDSVRSPASMQGKQRERERELITGS